MHIRKRNTRYHKYSPIYPSNLLSGELLGGLHCNMCQNNAELSAELSIPFSTKEEAEIAYGTLSVDSEPKRGGVKKVMTVSDNVITVQFKASEARLLRVSINSLFEHLNLVIQTIDQFSI